ncbi:NTC20 (YBR188C) [Zygosaccharomyces parabailii]|uniref:BN860_06546g1_1 n=1 Tax=Zygosaccharomyces bailii (strain CLIB 213 / ATCC 58445 / CBS 680 / BCRC 21525 / NBRC 1098 / NCYC 1416 / NRRL Y-2227) TaxID=1333698 RepID=A0A8J2T2W9_ZYGB2|nr:NTC20 (YBR188C) [Zygosaccharomyces parabailii]CDF88287.1 BN860_06546g1_1 [Zygosaccharomyces bailii CLIB 213]CDH14819.1 uncharacterized protein ZBAI_06605 [Zygosaccharomyces bailii ISA1307]
MSSIQEQIEARKKRLERLQKLHKLEKQTAPETSSSNDEHTVESLSLRAEQDSLNKLKQRASHIIQEIVNDDKTSRIGTEKKIDGTESMQAALQDQLDELDKRTNAKIKMLVRKRILKSAVSEE